MVLSQVMLKTFCDISMQNKIYSLWPLQIENLSNSELQV